MGYTTDFSGSLTLSRPATQEEIEYINKFSETRRMKRDVKKLFELFEGKHGNPHAKTREEIYGNEGEYFVGGLGSFGQDSDASVINNNCPPGQLPWGERKSYEDNDELIEKGLCQPGLWCQWILTGDGTELQWDGGEKFYYYTEWLKYLINHFFEKWDIKLNGEIEWVGEDSDDRGIIVVKNNKVKVYRAQITYPGYGEDEDEE